MKAKSPKKALTKSTRKNNNESPPLYYTEGHWEDEFEYWSNYQPTSNNGKWWVTIQLEKLKNKIKSYQ
jgi:hypothetical protein